MRRSLIVVLACLALTGAAVLAATIVLDAYTAPGPLAQAQDVVVPHGTAAQVAGALRRHGVVRNVWTLRAAAALTVWQGPLHAAELAFPARASLEVVLRILRTARPVQHLLTIPEGLTAAQIGQDVAQASGLAGDVVLPPEGGVLPESYAYELGAEGDALLGRAGRAMAALATEIWAARAPGLPLADKRQLVVLASLVERETHIAAERPLVAAVFLNRLRRGMRLQSDPSTAYAESGGAGELPDGLTRDALGRATPYNTYVVPGLPAGPICAPGRAALQATAHPARSEALYFVADGTGGHAFADTLAEHARNVARYRRQSAPETR